MEVLFAEEIAGYSDEYDAEGNGNGIIIPSSEKYVNGLYTESTKGSASLGFGAATNVWQDNFDYNFNRIYYKKELDQLSREVQNDDGELITEYYIINDGNHWHYVTDHTTNWSSKDGEISKVTGTLARTANYLYLWNLYLWNLDLYDFSNAETANDTFTADVQDYASTDDHLINTKVTPSLDGPVNDTGSYGSTSNARPTYEAKVGLTTGSFDVTGGSDTNNYQLVTNMNPADSSHVSWTTLTLSDDDKNLGTVGSLSYHGDGIGMTPAEVYGESSEMAGVAMQQAIHKMNNWIGYGKDTDTVYEQSSMSGSHTYANVTSDKLILGYDAKTILAEETHDVKFDDTETWSDKFSAVTSKYPSYLVSQINSTISAMNSYFTNVDKETYESSPAFGKTQQTIPSNQANGSYPTSINSANYKRVLLALAGEGTSASPDGILADYAANEQIIVQTPVVAPVSIHGDTGNSSASQGESDALTPSDGTTQLAGQTATDGRNPDLTQLRLDETYWFKFDPRTHLQTQGYSDIDAAADGKFDNTWDDDTIKFDKYVKAKYVHFPFAVCLYENGSSTPTYYPYVSDENADNYLIKLYDKDDGDTTENIEWTKFYIPAWAIEGSYADDDGIRYKVESINVTTDDGADYRNDPAAEHDSLNDDGSDLMHPDEQYYTATYDIDVQVSGWIYDFQVIGTNNRDLYDPEMSAEISKSWHDLVYPFCFSFEEKKSGTLNRFGGDDRCSSFDEYVRYSKTGQIAHEGDSVSITPTFWYLTKDRGNDCSKISEMYNITDSNLADVENVFQESMQTWYGEYLIPSKLYLTKLTQVLRIRKSDKQKREQTRMLSFCLCG